MRHAVRVQSETAALSVVSLFTGAGGLDIGLERSGFRVVCATDFDADCVATLETNRDAGIPIAGFDDGRTYLEGTRVVRAPIERLKAADLRPERVDDGWRPDLLVGGPPCQPFSSAGKMLSIHDPRGQLFRHFVRMARQLKPRLILFENVSGLVTAKGPSGAPGEALLVVKASFERIGYATTFALLNSADFGSPQRRVRCFMLASRHRPLPRFPQPTHFERASEMYLPGSRPWCTLGDFLTDFPDPTEFEIDRPTPDLEVQLERLSPGSGLKSRGIREATRPGGHWGYKQGMWVADPGRPARTVTAATSQDWVRGNDGRLRRLTWRECAGLQGFPRDWQFLGNKASRFRQIGNAVPAVFGEVLGGVLLEALHGQRQQRRARLAVSAPLPTKFTVAIAYTKKEHARNGESRAFAKAQMQEGIDPHLLKGLGSDDAQLADVGASGLVA